MKKRYFKLLVFVFCLCVSFVNSAKADFKVFVDSISAERAIRKAYGNIKTRYDKFYIINSTDDKIFERTLSEYNKMLFANGGFVTSDRVHLVCATPFYDFEEARSLGVETVFKLEDIVYKSCKDFLIELLKVASISDCDYEIDAFNNTFEVRYTRKGGKDGFVRKCNNYAAWRFNNPGNLRDADNACKRLTTIKSGTFAVFSNVTAGFNALEKLLRSEISRTTDACGTFAYADLNARDAIRCYCPEKDRYNDTEGYIKHLAQEGVDVDRKKLRDYTTSEMSLLMDAIAKIEGYYQGKKNCPPTEYF
jgi:hypothetical protein